MERTSGIIRLPATTPGAEKPKSLKDAGAQGFLLRLIARCIPKGDFAKGVIVLGGASVATQALGVVLSPIYSRLYTPADYGLFSTYIGIVSTLLTFISLCYEQAIPLGGSDEEAFALMCLTVLITLVLSISGGALLLVGMKCGVGHLHSGLGGYEWFIPVGLASAGVYRAIRYWAIRSKAMDAIARTTITQSLGGNVINLAGGLLSHSPLGLVLGSIAANGSGVMWLARRVRLLTGTVLSRIGAMSLGKIWITAKQYRKFPLIAAPSSAFNCLGLYLPTMLIGPLFGADFGGQFFMAQRLVGMPVALITAAFGQAFLGGAAELARERPRELKAFFDKVSMRLGMISLVVLGAGFAAPSIVPRILGSRWDASGEIVKWLCFYGCGALVSSTLSSVPSVTGKFRGQFALDLTRAVAVFLVLFLGHHFGLTGMSAVKLYSVVMLLNYAACYVVYRRQLGVVCER